MDKEPQDGKKSGKFRLSRDVIIFTVGLLGVIHETFREMAERPSLLILFAGMMGLPLYLRKNGL